MLQYLLIGSLILSSALVVYAQNMDTDYGYVIVKCTVTVNIDVLDEQATAWFLNQYGGIGTGETHVSISSITVVNISNGAIVKYAVMVSSIQRNEDSDGSGAWISDDDDFDQGIKGWTLDSSPGICQFVLYAVFANARPASGDFADNDQFTVNLAGANPTPTQRDDHTYKTGGDKYDPATNRYDSALGNDTGVNFVAPYDMPGYERGLWFKIITPTAVTDELPRRIIIRVDGGLGNAW